MSLVQGWYPPSRENWEFIAYAWQFFLWYAHTYPHDHHKS